MRIDQIATIFIWVFGQNSRDLMSLDTKQVTQSIAARVRSSELLLKELECCVCYELCGNDDTGVFQCINCHTLCKPCLLQLVTADAVICCPMCKVPIAVDGELKLINNKSLKRMCEDVLVPCRFNCGEEVAIIKRAAHEEKTCPVRSFPCHDCKAEPEDDNRTWFHHPELTLKRILPRFLLDKQQDMVSEHYMKEHGAKVGYISSVGPFLAVFEVSGCRTAPLAQVATLSWFLKNTANDQRLFIRIELRGGNRVCVQVVNVLHGAHSGLLSLSLTLGATTIMRKGFKPNVWDSLQQEQHVLGPTTYTETEEEEEEDKPVAAAAAAAAASPTAAATSVRGSISVQYKV
jgi:hypothetical protein